MKVSTDGAADADRGSAFAILANRDYRLYWIGACLSFIGSWVQTIALGLYVYNVTNSKHALGVIGLASGIPSTIFLLFGGVVADRVNKRTLVLLTQTVFALTAFALAALTWTHTIQVWHIVSLSFVNGLVFAADGPARQAMVYDLVGREQLANGVALQSAAFNMARVIGPAVGAITYKLLGPGWCFFINGVSFFCIILAIMAIRADLTKRGEASGSVWDGFLHGMRQLRGNRPMRLVVMMTMVTSVFAFSCYSTLMPAFARDLLGMEERDTRYGLLFSAVGLGALVGVYFVGRFAGAGQRGRLMMTSACVFGVALLCLAHASRFSVAFVLLAVIGMTAISQLATANTLTQTLAPAALRGRAVSTHMFAMGGLQPFGAYMAGVVAQAYGVPAALTLGGSVLLVYAVGTLALRPEVHRLE
jgi:MFS family permease